MAYDPTEKVAIKLPGVGTMHLVRTRSESGYAGTVSTDPIPEGPKSYLHAVDAVESLVLSHFCAGVNVADPKYVSGLITTMDTLENEHF